VLCVTHFLWLPSDPTVTSYALAIRIIFPPVGVMPELLRPGLPAMLGKQKNGRQKPPVFLIMNTA